MRTVGGDNRRLKIFFVLKPFSPGEHVGRAAVNIAFSSVGYAHCDNIVFVGRDVFDYGACGGERNIMFA